MRYIILVALVLSFFGSHISGSSNTVMDIVPVGNNNIEDELIKSIINIEIGSALTDERVSNAIRNLHKLSVFDDITIKKEEVPGGIRLIIEITEFPVIGNIKYEGNKRMRRNKLNEIVTLKEGMYLSPHVLNRIRRNILKEYQGLGHNYAHIEFEIAEVEEGLKDLTIIIDEGERIAVRRIDFFGNRYMTDRQLYRRMKTRRTSLLRSGRFEQEVFENDLQSIVDYYQENGFIDAKVLSWDIDVTEDSYLEISIYVDEGRQYFFGDIVISGNERFTDEVLLESFVFEEDEIFNIEKLERQIGGIASNYYEEGYIYASFDHDLIRDNDRIRVVLNINENNRAKIRKIFITGNRRTKEKVVRRQLAISPGEYFRQSRIIRTQQNIYNLGFFEPNIHLDYQPVNRDGDIDLLIALEDRHSGSANAGVGYNSQDGFIGQLSVSHNNLFGNAWQSGLSWEFGGRTQNFQFDFTNPHVFDTYTLGGFNIYHTRRDWSSFNYKVYTTGGSLRVGRSLFFLDNSRLVANYSYYRKKYEVINPQREESEYLLELDRLGWRNTSSLSLTFTRDSRDNIFYPTSGTHMILYSEIAGGPLQGDFDYFKQILQATWHTRTFWKLVLRSKWRFGYVTPYGDSEEVPPDEVFFLGGTGPDGLRGYMDRSIPSRRSGGGRRAIIHSTEFTAPLAGDQIIGLLFFDAGNSFNNLRDFNFWDFKKGTGLGVRVHTPLGLIGFDYGYSLEHRSWEPHFQFGATF